MPAIPYHLATASLVSLFQRFTRRAAFVCAVVTAGIVAYAKWPAAIQPEKPSDPVETLRQYAAQVRSIRWNPAAGVQQLAEFFNQPGRPEGLDAFVFNQLHVMVYSTRLDASRPRNFQAWLITPSETLGNLASKLQGEPTLYRKTTPSALREWKVPPGHVLLTRLDPTNHYLMLFLPDFPVKSDGRKFLPVVFWAAGSGAASGLVVFLLGLHATGVFRMVWQSGAAEFVAHIEKAVASRSQFRAQDVHQPELSALVRKLEFWPRELSRFDAVEQQLKSQERSGRAVLNSMNDCVFVVDEEGKILWGNRRVAEVLGADRRAMIGSSVLLYVGEAGKEQELRQAIEKAWHYEPQLLFLGFRNLHDGSVFPAEVHVSRVSLNDTASLCVSVRDITVHRRNEAALQRALADLEMAMQKADQESKAKSEFVAKMTHEIRAPMNAIIGLCDLGIRRAKDDATRENLEKIKSSAHNLIRVINEVLDYSKMSAGKVPFVKEPFRLSLLMEEALEFCKIRAAGRPLAFDLRIEAGLPDVLLGDQGRIKQVLINFCENAVKFTKAGVISLLVNRSSNPPGQILFRVADEGIGISKEKIASLFSDYQQADETIGRKYGGTGLGLSICKLIVESMGGTIGVESEEGVGSTFWFTLPLPEASAEEINPGKQERAPLAIPALRGRKVLVVDDDPLNREVSAALFQDAGLQVMEAADGVAAFECMLRENFDIIVLDIEMQPMDGLATCRNLRRLPNANATAFVIGLSSHLSGAMEETAKKAGMDAYVTKPLSHESFHETMREYLRKHPAAHSGGNLAAVPEQKEESTQTPPSANGAQGLENGASGESSASGGEVIEPEQALSKIGNNTVLYQRLLNAFRSDSLPLLEQLAQDSSLDAAQMIRLAHRLRSSTALIGAMELSALCVEIEEKLRAGSAVEDVAPLRASILRIAPIVKNQLEQLITRFQT